MTRVQDVITEDFVRDSVEELVEADLVYRQVFDQIDASGIGSNAYTFNIAKDNMGRVQTVPEGSEIPRHFSDIEQLTVTFDKFAGELAMTMEAEADSLMDMKAREVNDLGEAMDERLNDEAFQELNNNVQDTAAGDANDSFSFADIRDGIIAVRKENYAPDTMILDLDAYGDLLTDSNFNRATSSGDSVVATGEIGEIAGLNVVVDNRKNIVAGGHGAFLVDTSKYGYELQRQPMGTERYPEPSRQADVIQVFTRRAWKSIFPNAAVKIDG